jgi:hypothetical protein
VTAINVLKTEDAVHMLTDGRVGAGAVIGTLAKMMPLPHLNAAIATRGPARLLGLMSLMLCTKTVTFEDLVAEVHRLEWVCGHFKEPWQIESLAADFDLVVIGIGQDGPKAYLVSNHGLHGLDPWHVLELPEFLVTPTVNQELPEAVFCADDPLTELPRLVEHQRATNVSVGGFVQLTTVTAAGITTSIVRNWR